MNERPLLSSPQQTGKWLEGIRPDEPYSRAAGLALSIRLEYVASLLPEAAFAADQDTELVHQLRVASRRAAAALDAFAPCLPPKKSRKLRRRLRSVRQAAGAARDLDVLLHRLLKANDAFDQDARQAGIELLWAQRIEVQQPIVLVAKRRSEEEWSLWISRLVGHIRWRGDGDEPTVYAAGQQRMHQVVREFCKAGEGVGRGSPVDRLHELRIAGKRLRYTIELFACVAEDFLRHTVYLQVEELQERLGAINDHATAERLLREYAQTADSPGPKGQLNRLANHEREAIEPCVDAFLRWWSAGRFSEIQAGALAAFPPRSGGTLPQGSQKQEERTVIR
jgi:CHAD domain-containing protein